MKFPLSDTTFFRKQFSISQEDLAEYLGISYSLLAMHERGGRSLPVKALTRFGELLLSHEAAKKSAKAGRSLLAMQPKFNGQHDKAIEKMQVKVYFKSTRADMLKHELKGLTAKQDGAAVWLNIIDKKLAALPKTAAAKGERQWLQQQQTKISKAMLKTNGQLLKLQLNIALLQAAVNAYEAQQLILKKGNKL